MSNDFDDKDCPLCLEKLEVDDLHFYPCSCSFQICRFCWHRIRNDENGLCPACRQPYSENPVTFCPMIPTKSSQNTEKKKVKEKKCDIIEARKHLAAYRVIQRNLVYLVGLPPEYANEKLLRSIFEKNGKITNMIIGNLPSNFSEEHLNTAYITYSKEDDALQAICDNCSLRLGGRNIKVTLGTTKYCAYYLKAEPCTRQECSYLHDVAPPDISFTKEDMQQGKHMEYEKELINDLYLSKNIFALTLPPSSAETSVKNEKTDDKSEIIEARKHLLGYRVIQRNLVYVVGLPEGYANEKVLRSIFEKNGKITNMIIGNLPSNFSEEHLNTAYITYSKDDDALEAIYDNSALRLGGRNIKVTLGTTKYCAYFLKGEPCTRQECSYLHAIASPDISFTKEDMQQGKHVDYEKDLIRDLYRLKNILTFSSPIAFIETPKKPEKKVKEKKNDLIEARKHLLGYRVIQRNLVYVVGLPEGYANEKVLRSIFEKHGKITNMIIGNLPSNFSEEHLNTAYITYSKDDDALEAIYENSGLRLGGRNIKVTLGTTKYCAYYLKAEPCTRQECSYLHEIAPPEISFTKEDMQQGKHMEYEKELIHDLYRF